MQLSRQGVSAGMTQSASRSRATMAPKLEGAVCLKGPRLDSALLDIYGLNIDKLLDAVV